MTEPVRLAKRVAEMVPCSRREAEIYIEGGWVTVGGKVIEEPQFRVGTEPVILHPHAKLAEPEPVTILLHLTPGADAASPVIGIDNHASDDTSGIKPLKRHFSRLAATLPLQTNASGLVVLTQDWRVSRKLVDSASTVEQEYVVEVAADVSPETLKQLNRRVTLGGSGREMPAAKVSLQSERRLRIALKGTHAGHVAQLCLNAEVQIVSVKRIRIGRIAMAKLQPGQWRYLPFGERF